ncbi:MAG: hypothetical protein AB7O66_16630 [Limisphaerales bacterium]
MTIPMPSCPSPTIVPADPSAEVVGRGTSGQTAVAKPGHGAGRLIASILFVALPTLLVPWNRASAQPIPVVDAGYVSLEGYGTNRDGSRTSPNVDPRVAELDGIYKGSLRATASKWVGEYLANLAQSAGNVEVSKLSGPSRPSGSVDPGSVHLWLGSLSGIATLPEVFRHEPESRNNQFLAVTFVFYLVHLKSSQIVFGEQAMALLPWRHDRAITDDGLPERLLANAQKALQRSPDVAGRFARSLIDRRYSGGTRSVYAVRTGDVGLPSNVEEMLRKHSPGPAIGQHLDSLRRLVAFETVQGLSSTHCMLPLLPDELLGDVQIGGASRSGLWASFNLGAIQELNLPPGALLDRGDRGYVVLNGRLPDPDFQVSVTFEYSEKEFARTAFQVTQEGTLTLNLEERAGTHRKPLLPPMVGRARANYANNQPFTARALSLALSNALRGNRSRP